MKSIKYRLGHIAYMYNRYYAHHLVMAFICTFFCCHTCFISKLVCAIPLCFLGQPFHTAQRGGNDMLVYSIHIVHHFMGQVSADDRILLPPPLPPSNKIATVSWKEQLQ